MFRRMVSLYFRAASVEIEADFPRKLRVPCKFYAMARPGDVMNHTMRRFSRGISETAKMWG